MKIRVLFLLVALGIAFAAPAQANIFTTIETTHAAAVTSGDGAVQLAPGITEGCQKATLIRSTEGGTPLFVSPTTTPLDDGFPMEASARLVFEGTPMGSIVRRPLRVDVTQFYVASLVTSPSLSIALVCER